MPRIFARVLLAACCALYVGCGDEGSGRTTSPSTAAGTQTAAAAAQPAPLVGEWQRLTTCAEYVRALRHAGFGAMALEAAAGNGFIPGVERVEDIKDPAHPCEGALPRKHSHFFTENGMFGSLDSEGNQVDDGSYETVGADTLVMPYRFEEGAPIEITFRYAIAGDTIKFQPKIPSPCSTRRCREAAAWGVSVALPGKPWTRVDESP